MKRFIPFILIALLVILFYLPIIIHPGLVLDRGNDLEEFFWPVIYFVKNQIITNKTIPLWNNLFLSGTPLLPDPQGQIFYLPNLIFLVLPIDTAFILSFIFHTFVGGIGIYLCAKEGFGLSKKASLFSSFLYVAIPKLAGYLEAGHFGLIASTAWIPFVVLTIVKTAKNPRIKWSIVLAISLAGIFYTHTITFLIIAVLSLPMVFTLNQINKKIPILESLFYFLLGGVFTFGLTAISLLPQLEWSSQTTRLLLLQNHDVYPQWNSIREFIKAIFFPALGGLKAIANTDSEKWIPIGLFPSVLAVVGFFKLKKGKVALLVLTLVVLLVSLNNLNPLYFLLINQGWYNLIRVITRFWFIIILVTVFLSGLAINEFTKKKNISGFYYFLSYLAIIESVALGWILLFKPIKKNVNLATGQVYEFLTKDKDRFRVFCTTRCLSQKTSAIYGLELLDGYNTLQQMNFYKHAWQLTQSYWNYYTLLIPPIGTYLFTEIQPNAKSLGEYNVKYIISPHKLNDRNFSLKTKISDFFIYENLLFLPRAYFQNETKTINSEAKIVNYKPNFIRIDTKNKNSNRLVLSEVYSPGWTVYLNGVTKTKVQETPESLRLVDLNENTKMVDFKYQPDSFKKGKTITGVTLILIISLIWLEQKKKNGDNK